MSKKRKQSGKKKTTGYNTGSVARLLYSNLLRDFRRTEGSDFFNGADYDLMSDVKLFRSREATLLAYPSVGRFKRTKQMESLLKKFRFEQDAFTDDELSEKTLNSFLEEQLRLHRPMPLKASGFRVLQRARVIAQRILGEFPGDEVIENVQFGKKSSIGCSLANAYLDIKLSDKAAFTGTKDTTAYFLDQVLPGDPVLSRILKTHDFSALEDQLSLDYLNLVEVPKTWDKYRLITPLTLIGLFYSYGIGRVVQSRLADVGLDIKRLQQRHRKLVEEFSRTLTHVTADLSVASDSITSELLNRVLPRAWYKALRKTFVRHLNVNDTSFSSASVLPMGNGATFPVETLVFYCILKAIGELTTRKRKKDVYSVYGDDCIYPGRIHKYVEGVFPQLHLKLNASKTFTSYPFRESCGADFYRGQDVRPYFLKGDSCELTSIRYEAFLYKVYNGLTARWDPLEIRDTLTWILSELSMVSRGIKRVPPSFPDYSGVKVDNIHSIPLDYKLLPWLPLYVQYRHGSSWFQFDFLTETPKKRIVSMVEPYYWLSLQGLNDKPDDEYARAFDEHLELVRVAPRTCLNWRSVTKKTGKYFYRNGKRFEKKRTIHLHTVPSRTGAAMNVARAGTQVVHYAKLVNGVSQPQQVITDTLSEWI
jgi:hypothetical protein